VNIRRWKKNGIQVVVALSILVLVYCIVRPAWICPEPSPARARALQVAYIQQYVEDVNRVPEMKGRVDSLVLSGYTLNEALAHIFWKEDRLFAEQSGCIKKGSSGREVLLDYDGSLCVFRRLQDGSIVYISDDIADSNDVEESLPAR
jgi:hypothetical protein